MSDMTPLLRPLTDEARKAIQRDERPLTHLPYRVGRERRVVLVAGEYRSAERRHNEEAPTNDLYLLDMGEKLNVSREHFKIDQDGQGRYILVDRGSACGTIVDEQPVGGHDNGGEALLRDGSTIRVGTSVSPYLFMFVIPEPS